MKVNITSQNILFMFLVCFTFVVLPYNQKVFSQEPIKFNRLSIEDGLSQSSVECIAQDSLGYMWFGTEGGVNDSSEFDPDILIDNSSLPPIVLTGFDDNWIQSGDRGRAEDHDTNNSGTGAELSQSL